MRTVPDGFTCLNSNLMLMLLYFCKMGTQKFAKRRLYGSYSETLTCDIYCGICMAFDHSKRLAANVPTEVNVMYLCHWILIWKVKSVPKTVFPSVKVLPIKKINYSSIVAPLLSMIEKTEDRQSNVVMFPCPLLSVEAGGGGRFTTRAVNEILR